LCCPASWPWPGASSTSRAREVPVGVLPGPRCPPDGAARAPWPCGHHCRGGAPLHRSDHRTCRPAFFPLLRAAARAAGGGRVLHRHLPRVADASPHRDPGAPARRSRPRVRIDRRAIIAVSFCSSGGRSGRPVSSGAGRKPCGWHGCRAAGTTPPGQGAKAAEANTWAGCTRALHRRSPGMGATTVLPSPAAASSGPPGARRTAAWDARQNGRRDRSVPVA